MTQATFPSLIEPQRQAERALLAVVQEADVLGVSTRRVEGLDEILGISGLSRSQVSRICAALDAEVEAFRGRSLAGETYPYLWLDATTARSVRCRVHFTRNAQDLVPCSARGMVATVIHTIFEQPDETAVPRAIAPGFDELANGSRRSRSCSSRPRSTCSPTSRS